MKERKFVSILFIIMFILMLISVTAYAKDSSIEFETGIHEKHCFYIDKIVLYNNKIIYAGNYPSIDTIDYDNSTLQSASEKLGIVLPIDIDYNYSTGKTFQLLKTGLELKGIDELELAMIEKQFSPKAGVVTYPSLVTIVYAPNGVSQSEYKDNINFTLKYNNSIAYLVYDWNALKYYYKAYTGVNVSSVIHRVYSIQVTPLSLYYGYPSTMFHEIDINDTITNSSSVSYTVLNATINFTGEPSDWPSGSVAYQDTPDHMGSIPGVFDAVRIYVAADSESVYIGVERADALPPDTVNIKTIIKIYVDINLDGKPDGYLQLSYSNNEPIQASFYQAGASTPLTVKKYNTSGPVIEVALPLIGLPKNFWAGHTLSITPSYYEADLASVPVAPANVKAKVIEVSIDEVSGRIIGGSDYGLYRAYLSKGTGVEVKTPDIRILFPEVTGYSSLDLGTSATRPILAPWKAYPPSGLRLGGYYYFTIGDPTTVSWPIKVYLNMSTVKGNIQIIKVYYYSKSIGGYTLLPEKYIKYYQSNKTLEITMTESLYKEGDPGIVVYVGSTIGGSIVGDSGLSGFEYVLLGSFMISSIILSISYKISRIKK